MCSYIGAMVHLGQFIFLQRHTFYSENGIIWILVKELPIWFGERVYYEKDLEFVMEWPAVAMFFSFYFELLEIQNIYIEQMRSLTFWCPMDFNAMFIGQIVLGACMKDWLELYAS